MTDGTDEMSDGNTDTCTSLVIEHCYSYIQVNTDTCT